MCVTYGGLSRQLPIKRDAEPGRKGYDAESERDEWTEAPCKGRLGPSS